MSIMFRFRLASLLLLLLWFFNPTCVFLCLPCLSRVRHVFFVPAMCFFCYVHSCFDECLISITCMFRLASLLLLLLWFLACVFLCTPCLSYVRHLFFMPAMSFLCPACLFYVRHVLFMSAICFFHVRISVMFWRVFLMSVRHFLAVGHVLTSVIYARPVLTSVFYFLHVSKIAFHVRKVFFFMSVVFWRVFFSCPYFF